MSRKTEEERGLVLVLAHELLTPLAAIRDAAAALARENAGLDEATARRLLAVIAGESARLVRLVNDVLAASRLDAGRLDVVLEACDAAALARSAVEAARARLPEGTSIELTAPADLPPVSADPDRLHQVLTNLVDNAVKYSPRGAVVHVLAEVVDGRARLAVRDEGPGIPPEDQERIFEPFRRLDSAAERGAAGTGLGLYLCRELVGRMGGRIWVDSAPGRGSTFLVELPLAA